MAQDARICVQRLPFGRLSIGQPHTEVVETIGYAQNMCSMQTSVGNQAITEHEDKQVCFQSLMANGQCDSPR